MTFIYLHDNPFLPFSLTILQAIPVFTVALVSSFDLLVIDTRAETGNTGVLRSTWMKSYDPLSSVSRSPPVSTVQ